MPRFDHALMSEAVQFLAGPRHLNGVGERKHTQVLDLQFCEDPPLTRLDTAKVPGHKTAVEQGTQAMQVQAAVPARARV